MPHLDASALTEDPQGMAFLASVIGLTPDPATATARIDLPEHALDFSLKDGAESQRPAHRRRRHSVSLVPEAA